jgi:hypothetical protein
VRAIYRSRQFFGSVRPRVNAVLRDEAFRLLSEPQRALFAAMTVRDQQHCLAVYERLRAQGERDADLLVAALLHDCGKGRIALWHRVAHVALAATAPRALDGVARRGDGASWREALYRLRHHPEIGARLASEAGCSPATVALIREDPGAPRERLAALHAADEAV